MKKLNPILMKNFSSSRISTLLYQTTRSHSHVPGRVGGGIGLRSDLVVKPPTPDQLSKGDHRSGVVLSKRIPEEFIQTTLLPHLEERMRASIHVYTPSQLVQVARSYAKYTVDREDRGAGPLVENLVETVKYRMAGFEAMDIIDILPAALQLSPNDDELFTMLAERMKEKIDDFNALNLVGVVRTYLKRGDVQVVKEILLPRLIESLKSYDTVEVAEMLIAIGQATGTDMSLSGDVHILQCLVPEVEQRFAELPTVVQLNCVWALAKMNVNHAMMRSTVVERFQDAKLVGDLPTKILAKSIWTFGRIGALSDPTLLATLMGAVRANRALFSAPEFARLVMGLASVPEAKPDLVAISQRLLGSLTSEEETAREAGTSTRKSRQEVMMLLSGLEGLSLIKGPNDPILAPIEQFFAKEEAKFEPTEIQQLVTLFHQTKNDAVIESSLFPATWKDLVVSSRKRIDQVKEMYH